MSEERHLFDLPTLREITAGKCLLGPRATSLRVLRGELVTEAELLADDSEFGWWRLDDPLAYRPPELWADAVHYHCYGGDE